MCRQWANTAGTLLGAGLPVATTTAANAIVETGSGGIIDNSFLPPFSGAITISLGVTSYSQVVPSTKGGAGSISGALKADGSGNVTQAAASDLTNGVTGPARSCLLPAPHIQRHAGGTYCCPRHQHHATCNHGVCRGCRGRGRCLDPGRSGFLARRATSRRARPRRSRCRQRRPALLCFNFTSMA